MLQNTVQHLKVMQEWSHLFSILSKKEAEEWVDSSYVHAEWSSGCMTFQGKERESCTTSALVHPLAVSMLEWGRCFGGSVIMQRLRKNLPVSHWRARLREVQVLERQLCSQASLQLAWTLLSPKKKGCSTLGCNRCSQGKAEMETKTLTFWDMTCEVAGLSKNETPTSCFMLLWGTTFEESVSWHLYATSVYWQLLYYVCLKMLQLNSLILSTEWMLPFGENERWTKSFWLN